MSRMWGRLMSVFSPTASDREEDSTQPAAADSSAASAAANALESLLPSPPLTAAARLLPLPPAESKDDAEEKSDHSDEDDDSGDDERDDGEGSGSDDEADFAELERNTALLSVAYSDDDEGGGDDDDSDVRSSSSSAATAASAAASPSSSRSPGPGHAPAKAYKYNKQKQQWSSKEVLEHTRLTRIAFEAEHVPKKKKKKKAAKAAYAPAPPLSTAAVHAVLPTNEWATCLRLSEAQLHSVSSFDIVHGKLPPLEVRYLRHAWAQSARHQDELDEALEWMLEDLDKERPCIGLDAESGERSIRLIQISTRSRCLLLRLPGQDAVKAVKTVFSQKFRDLVANRKILKSGAELWTDALEMWGDCLRLPVNGCCNVSLSYVDDGGCSTSLESMLNVCVGKDAFRKDKISSVSDWDADKAPLTLRQLIYAALDAQTSFLVAAQSVNPLPPLLHVSDLPPHWMDRASAWRHQQRREELEDQRMIDVAYESADFHAEGFVTVHMKAYQSRIRKFSNVVFFFSDGSDNAMKVEKVDGKRARLSFKGGGDALSRSRRAEHLVSVKLNRADEGDIMRQPAQRYFSKLMHGGEGVHPFVHSLLQLNMNAKRSANSGAASSSDSESEAPTWWRQPMLRNEHDFESMPEFRALNESQQRALRLTDQQRMTIVQGPPGTGKTKTIAVEALRTISRSSTIVPSSSLRPPQRMLCVAETNAAARHMCTAIAKHLGPDQMQLLVSQEFEYDWHEADYVKLRADGYMIDAPPMPVKGADGVKRKPKRVDTGERQNPPVLVCTLGMAIAHAGNREDFQQRQTLVLDEASQIWDLKAVLLLRMLPDTERFVMVGDDKQLAPYVAREEATSVLDMANETIVAANKAAAAASPSAPPAASGWSVGRTMLDVQYRMRPHLGNIISEVFYSGMLESFKTNTAVAVKWRHVYGQPKQFGTSTYNLEEIAEVARLWQRYLDRGYKLHDIVVICLYEAQRKELSNKYPTMRVANVDSFQGQEAPIVILTLCARQLSKFNCDRRRVNVACSRAQEKLYIVGNKAPHLAVRSTPKKRTCWNDIIDRIDGWAPPSSAVAAAASTPIKLVTPASAPARATPAVTAAARVAPQSFEIGTCLDVRDSTGRWLEARIVASDPLAGTVNAHFLGWASKWDESLNIHEHADRFAPLHQWSSWTAQAAAPTEVEQTAMRAAAAAVEATYTLGDAVSVQGMTATVKTIDGAQIHVQHTAKLASLPLRQRPLEWFHTQRDTIVNLTRASSSGGSSAPSKSAASSSASAPSVAATNQSTPASTPASSAAPAPTVRSANLNAQPSFESGTVLDVRDFTGRWLEARIVSNLISGVVSVHFLGWDERWNETLDVRAHAHRFAPLHRWSSWTEHAPMLPTGAQLAVMRATAAATAAAYSVGDEVTVQGIAAKVKAISGAQIHVQHHAALASLPRGQRPLEWFHTQRDAIVNLTRAPPAPSSSAASTPVREATAAASAAALAPGAGKMSDAELLALFCRILPEGATSLLSTLGSRFKETSGATTKQAISGGMGPWLQQWPSHFEMHLQDGRITPTTSVTRRSAGSNAAQALTPPRAAQFGASTFASPAPKPASFVTPKLTAAQRIIGSAGSSPAAALTPITAAPPADPALRDSVLQLLPADGSLRLCTTVAAQIQKIIGQTVEARTGMKFTHWVRAQPALFQFHVHDGGHTSVGRALVAGQQAAAAAPSAIANASFSPAAPLQPSRAASKCNVSEPELLQMIFDYLPADGSQLQSGEIGGMYHKRFGASFRSHANRSLDSFLQAHPDWFTETVDDATPVNHFFARAQRGVDARASVHSASAPISLPAAASPTAANTAPSESELLQLIFDFLPADGSEFPNNHIGSMFRARFGLTYKQHSGGQTMTNLLRAHPLLFKESAGFHFARAQLVEDIASAIAASIAQPQAQLLALPTGTSSSNALPTPRRPASLPKVSSAELVEWLYLWLPAVGELGGAELTRKFTTHIGCTCLKLTGTSLPSIMALYPQLFTVRKDSQHWRLGRVQPEASAEAVATIARAAKRDSLREFSGAQLIELVLSWIPPFTAVPTSELRARFWTETSQNFEAVSGFILAEWIQSLPHVFRSFQQEKDRWLVTRADSAEAAKLTVARDLSSFASYSPAAEAPAPSVTLAELFLSWIPAAGAVDVLDLRARFQTTSHVFSELSGGLSFKVWIRSLPEVFTLFKDGDVWKVKRVQSAEGSTLQPLPEHLSSPAASALPPVRSDSPAASSFVTPTKPSLVFSGAAPSSGSTPVAVRYVSNLPPSERAARLRSSPLAAQNGSYLDEKWIGIIRDLLPPAPLTVTVDSLMQGIIAELGTYQLYRRGDPVGLRTWLKLYRQHFVFDAEALTVANAKQSGGAAAASPIVAPVAASSTTAALPATAAPVFISPARLAGAVAKIGPSAAEVLRAITDFLPADGSEVQGGLIGSMFRDRFGLSYKEYSGDSPVAALLRAHPDRFKERFHISTCYYARASPAAAAASPARPAAAAKADVSESELLRLILDLLPTDGTEEHGTNIGEMFRARFGKTYKEHTGRKMADLLRAHPELFTERTDAGGCAYYARARLAANSSSLTSASPSPAKGYGAPVVRPPPSPPASKAPAKWSAAQLVEAIDELLTEEQDGAKLGHRFLARFGATLRTALAGMALRQFLAAHPQRFYIRERDEMPFLIGRTAASRSQPRVKPDEPGEPGEPGEPALLSPPRYESESGQSLSAAVGSETHAYLRQFPLLFSLVEETDGWQVARASSRMAAEAERGGVVTEAAAAATIAAAPSTPLAKPSSSLQLSPPLATPTPAAAHFTNPQLISRFHEQLPESGLVAVSTLSRQFWKETGLNFSAVSGGADLTTWFQRHALVFTLVEHEGEWQVARAGSSISAAPATAVASASPAAAAPSPAALRSPSAAAAAPTAAAASVASPLKLPPQPLSPDALLRAVLSLTPADGSVIALTQLGAKFATTHGHMFSKLSPAIPSLEDWLTVHPQRFVFVKRVGGQSTAARKVPLIASSAAAVAQAAQRLGAMKI